MDQKDRTGSKQFDNDFPYSIVKQLEINCIHATPYHGQAKTVERFFGIVADQFAKSFDTYCGADNKNRPEQMRISDEKIKNIAPTLDEFNSYFQNWVEEYNSKPNGGAFMNGESPNVVYEKNRIDNSNTTCKISFFDGFVSNYD